MTSEMFMPPPEFDFPSGQVELRTRHLIAEIAAADRARPRRVLRLPVRRLVFAPAAVVVAVCALLLIAPWQAPGPNVVDRALAAVGAGPVVHAVVEYSWPQDIVVDLSSGDERERLHRTEYWYDEERRMLRVRSSTDGNEPADYTYTVIGDFSLDASLAGFVTQYREALGSGRAEVVGATSVDGRPAKRIEFAPRNAGAVEEVLVDAETFVPLRFHTTYPPNGRRSPVWRIVSIESVARDPAQFLAAKPSHPTAAHGEVSEAGEISLAEATRVLGARPLWLGPSFDGHPLGAVELSRAVNWLTDGTRADGVHVALGYGPVKVRLAHDAAGGYAIGFGDAESPVPAEDVVAVNGSNREGWQGRLYRGEFAVALSAPTKEQLIDAAAALAEHP